MGGPQLERYEIREELGQGGMSVVYRAHDRQLDRDVAIKVLHDFLAKQSDARKRFHREAVAVAKLKHTGILEIFDYSGPDATDAYIVTELIDGTTLRDFAERINGLDHPELAVLLIAELGRALEHAHAHGVIHRDLKPENVMVTRDGQIKLMDFGIAQVNDGPRVTVTGTLLGSPAHMAPEVIDGHRPDQRADIFSLGTILYWLATKKLPFDAPNPSALFKRILAGEYEDPQMVEPKIGNGLAAIIRRALAADRDQRYPTTSEFVADLEVELAAVNVGPTELVAREFLADPDTYSRGLTPKLITILTGAGKQALADKSLGRAMDSFNRVLAIDAANKEVRSLVATVGKQRGLRLRARQTAVGFAVLIGAGLIGLTAAQLDPIPPPPELASGSDAVDTPLGPDSPKLTVVADRPALDTPIVAAVRAPSHAASRIDIAGTTPATGAGLAAALPASTPTPRTPRERPIEATKRPTIDAKIVAAPAQPAAILAPVKIAAPEPPPKPTPLQPQLQIKIGGSFADVIIDGRRARRDSFGGHFPLEPGPHAIEIVKPGYGAFRARKVHVGEDGAIMEVLADGGRRPLGGALLFRIPKPGDAAEPPGWVPIE